MNVNKYSKVDLINIFSYECHIVFGFGREIPKILNVLYTIRYAMTIYISQWGEWWKGFEEID